ncbi:MAG: exodeoxyribonuclease VII small subunit [Anaerolineae bacterium]|nr:exodeoxyribonuclease VII small subunit [Anaerolineae bacterium]
MSETQEIPFETAYAELETIIMQLESGELPLEESVTLFERGRKLAAYCQTLLDKAELRVNQINDAGDIQPLA